MGVRFFGPVNKHSGYGNAVINFAKAFSRSGIRTKFCFNKKHNGYNIIEQLNNYTGKTKVDFYLHCPPYGKHKSSAYKIAYFYWEADRLPANWVRGLNRIDEIWAPCDLVKNACIRANFKGKIRVIPTPCSDWNSEKEILINAPFSKNYTVSEDAYKFYSIFQWQNRKGYQELLNSYYRTFNNGDKVLLILKVNPLGISGYTREKIKLDILEIKRKINLKYYPPVFLMDKIVPGDTIKAIHNSADCYVSPHHGEGWGIPIHDAMRLGKQIIVTKFGGVTEYLNNESAHIIKHKMGPVAGMEWSPLYNSNQNWAYPSVNHLSFLFRDIYENHESYKKRGLVAQEVANTMTIDSVSKIIFKNLSNKV